MQVVMISELVYSEPRPKTVEEKQQKYDAVLASFNCPIHLGVALTVAHDVKSDRYALAFLPGNEKKLLLKATDEVSEFVTTLITESGYWVGRMESGTLVDACLIKA